MTPLPKSTFGMGVKELFSYNFSTKAIKKWEQTFLKPKFSLSIVKFKKLVFTAPLNSCITEIVIQINHYTNIPCCNMI